MVTIGYQLAVGKFEATLDAWNACVADGGCAYRPGEGSNPARGARPVIGVSWNDVTNGFLPWLNRRLGLSGANAYRLLTEAEWEYAARAGTTTRYAFGDIISTAQARFSEIDHALEVGSFAPNGFGLHDMHGNAPEWVQDCFENTAYDDAPVDGSVHTPRDCRNRAVRGGSWADHPQGSAAPRTAPTACRMSGAGTAFAWRGRSWSVDLVDVAWARKLPKSSSVWPKLNQLLASSEARRGSRWTSAQWSYPPRNKIAARAGCKVNRYRTGA